MDGEEGREEKREKNVEKQNLAKRQDQWTEGGFEEECLEEVRLDSQAEPRKTVGQPFVGAAGQSMALRESPLGPSPDTSGYQCNPLGLFL